MIRSDARSRGGRGRKAVGSIVSDARQVYGPKRAHPTSAGALPRPADGRPPATVSQLKSLDIEKLDWVAAGLLPSYKNKCGSIGVERRFTVRERVMKRLTTVVIALACGIGAVWADTDPIAQRRALMKSDGMAAKKMFDMSKGATPFDLATVQDSLKTLYDGASKSAALFPDDSKTGGGTAALPAIWQNKADFDARFVKFAKDVAAAQAGIVDEASFKKLAPAVFQNCGACHELYKAKSG
jgi:cytochrome c556